MKNIILISIFFIVMLLLSCGQKNQLYTNTNSHDSSVSNVKTSDSDSINNVEEIKIGTQIWSTKNLDVSTFRNGDKIPEVKSDSEWLKVGNEGKPAWCYYNNDTLNGRKYGKLYNWYAVNDARGLAPKGWHIPKYEEWTTLKNYLGEKKGVSKKMKSIWGWEDYQGKNGNGSNSSGFAGLPGGSRLNYGPFEDIGSKGSWFTFGECTMGQGLCNDNILFEWMDGSPSEIGGGGFSVRCLRD